MPRDNTGKHVHAHLGVVVLADPAFSISDTGTRVVTSEDRKFLLLGTPERGSDCCKFSQLCGDYII